MSSLSLGRDSLNLAHDSSSLAHADHPGATALAADILLPLAVLTVVSTGYVLLAWRRRVDPRGWSGWRTASFLMGAVLLAVALIPGMLPFPPTDFRGHMQQHLIIGMIAPLFLVLSAPMTLILRSLPRRHGKLVGRCLRSGPMHLLANPVTALLLSVGGTAALFFTPLYAAMMASEIVHTLMHVHFLVAGYLFAWVIAGPDPAPRRPTVPVRLVVLGVAIIMHAVMSQMLYAGVLTQVPVPAAERMLAAELMYYGGDIAELLLALALVTTWRPRRVGRPAGPNDDRVDPTGTNRASAGPPGPQGDLGVTLGGGFHREHLM